MSRKLKSPSILAEVDYLSMLRVVGTYNTVRTIRNENSAYLDSETETVTVRFGEANYKRGFSSMEAHRSSTATTFPTLNMPEVGDTFPPESLDALAGLFSESSDTAKQGFVFFNGETAVVLDQHRAVLIPCYIPLLLEKTEGRYTPIKRSALSLLLALWRVSRLRPSEYAPLTVTLSFDEVESLVVLDLCSSVEVGVRAVLATKLRIDSDWFDLSRVFDAVGTIPDTTFVVEADTVTRAIRKTAACERYDKAAEKKKARDDREKALFAFFVANSESSIALAVSSNQFVSDYERNLRFVDLTTVENEGYVGSHGMWLQYLMPVLKMQERVRLGFGESSEGDKYLVASLDNGVRVAFDAGTPKVL